MSAEIEWRRPHPLSIAVSIISFVANNAITVGFVVLAGGAGAGFELIGVAVGAVSVMVGVVQWWVTRYAVTDQAVEHRSGVLHRQARTVRLDRIQQVAVAEPVVARVFGLAAVQVSEASADGDISISYLSSAAAGDLTERLRALAREREQADLPPRDDGSALAPVPTYTVHRAALGDLVLYHLAISAPVALLGELVVLLAAVALAFGSGLLVGGLALVVGTIAVWVMVSIGLIGMILTFGGFELKRGDRGLTVDMGLLSKRHLEVRPDRMQTVTVASGPVARWAGLHQVVFSAAVGKATAETRVIHLGPAVRADAVAELMHRSIDLDPAFDEELEPVSPLTVRRFAVRAALVFMVVGLPVCVIGAVAVHPVVPVLALAAWVGVVVPFGRARYRRLGVVVGDDRMVMRQGVLTHRLTQLAPTNVQAVVVRSSVFQRRLGLSDLLVTTAGVGPGHMVRVPDLEADRADQMADRLARVASSTHWELGA